MITKALIWKILALGFIVLSILLAFILRIRYLNHSNHVAEVQYRAALIARSIYFNFSDSIPGWRRQVNLNSLANLPVKEPPITEWMAGIGYRIIGYEDLRIPKLLTILFWLVGGYFLFMIAQSQDSLEGAIISASYYLLVPLGVIVSISFQPDSLMIMLFVISLYAIIQYEKKRTWKRLIEAGIISGIAIFIKPLVLFAISGAFLGLVLWIFWDQKELRQLLNAKFLIFFTISLIPVIFYYLFGIFITRTLSSQAENSFLPQLLLTTDYWKDWLQTAVKAVGLTPLIAGILGIPLAKKGSFQAMLVGLWSGYIVYCLIFSYHIRYAVYYHAQLIPIVALSFLPLATKLINLMEQTSSKWYWSFVYIAASLLLFFMNFQEIRSLIWSSGVIESKEVAEEIGEIVGHNQNTVYIASYYGRPLEYYAEITGSYWPRNTSDINAALGKNQLLSIQERLNNLGFVPDYFVITAMNEFDLHHKDLKEFLEEKCHLVKASQEFVIYNSCSY